MRMVLFLGIAALAIAGFVLYGDHLTLGALADREAAFREFHQRQPWLVAAGAFGVYVAVAGLSLPGAAAMTLFCGWLFGFWRGLALASCASTAGAVLAFLLSRYLLRDAVRARFGDRLRAFNAALESEGAFYLFTLRLIPAVPFFVINVVMGLTPLRTRTFWWVSQIGMLPGTAAYVYAGSQLPSLRTVADSGVKGIIAPELLAAFVVLGLLPLAARRIIARLRPSQ